MAISSDWDARITSLEPVDAGSTNTLDEIAQNVAFDVLADVKIGENLNEHVDSFILKVAVVNLHKSIQVAEVTLPGTLSPANNTPFAREERVSFPALDPAKADVGDALRAVASYTVVAGINEDHSTAQSGTFVVI